MRKMILFIALVSFEFAFGQLDSSSLMKDYPFLHLKANKLDFPGGQKQFNRFFEKLDKLVFQGDGQVNVVHIGGSHVQAGILSEEIRQSFLHISPGLKGDRGFLFPMDLAGTNNPRNFKVQKNGQWEGSRSSVPAHKGRWGLAGIQATTSDTNATFSITALDGDTGIYSFSAVRIYHVKGDSTFQFMPLSSMKIDTSWYDEIHHWTEFHFKHSYRTLEVGVKKTDSLQRMAVLQGVQFLSLWPGMMYHSIGVNGAATKSYLRSQDFAIQMPGIAPDLVVFGIGINDAYVPENQFDPTVFEKRYDSLVSIIRDVNPDCQFIWLTNNDSYYKRRYANPNGLTVREVMYKLAKKYHGAVYDLFEVMGGLNSIRYWDQAGLASRDRIHFTRPGYELAGKLFGEAFEQCYLNYLTIQYKD